MQISEIQTSYETQSAHANIPQSAAPDGSMRLAVFVESRFIPNHVERKTLAGRTHYRAILKHVITPELVDRLFTANQGQVNGRLKAIYGWPYLDDVRLCDITPNHIQNLTRSATERGYSHQTVKHIRNVVSVIFNHARKEKMFGGENPTSDVDLPPITHVYGPNLTIQQAKAILNSMEYPERELALLTMLTGLTISEICAVQWKHINLSRDWIYVDRACIPPSCIAVMKQWSGVEVIDRDPSRVRGVVIPAPLARALIKLKQHRKPKSLESFVISDQEGQPIPAAKVRVQTLRMVGEKLEMPWLSWQALKRSHKVFMEEFKVQLSADLVSTHWYSDASKPMTSARRGILSIRDGGVC